MDHTNKNILISGTKNSDFPSGGTKPTATAAFKLWGNDSSTNVYYVGNPLWAVIDFTIEYTLDCSKTIVDVKPITSESDTPTIQSKTGEVIQSPDVS